MGRRGRAARLGGGAGPSELGAAFVRPRLTARARGRPARPPPSPPSPPISRRPGVAKRLARAAAPLSLPPAVLVGRPQLLAPSPPHAAHPSPPPPAHAPRPTPPPPDTVIIFDWDDTLLSSSWLAANGLRLDEPAVVPADALASLDALAASVCALLSAGMAAGTVLVITNAETGWVELSARKFMPRVLPLLARLRVLSARSAFEGAYPDAPSEWKVHAFHQELSAAYAGAGAGRKRNVVSFGDSVHERAAIHKCTAGMGGAVRTKSVKFVERPTVEQLRRQVDLVAGCLDEIVSHNGSLDLMLTIQLLFN